MNKSTLLLCNLNCTVFYVKIKYILGSGESAGLGRTEEYLMNSIKSKANVCLICIETIKRNEAVSKNPKILLRLRIILNVIHLFFLL